MSSLKKFKFIQDDCHTTFLNNGKDSLDKLKNSVLLVTGGTGFLGTWLAHFMTYLNDNFNFDCKIYLLARSHENFSKENKFLLEKKHLHLIKGDIATISEIPRDINYIIHAAGSPDPSYHASHPISNIKAIVTGSINLLKCCEMLSSLKNILNFSSGFVYQDQNNTNVQIKPISEQNSLSFHNLSAANSYAEAKRFAELVFHTYSSQYHIPFAIIRPFAFIGPYQSLDLPWAHCNFIRDYIHQNFIRVLGDTSTVRSYLYGSDAAYWSLKGLIDYPSSESFNMGSPHSLSLQQFLDILLQSTNKETKLTHSSAPYRNKANVFVPDISKTQNIFNLKFIEPKQAIQNTVNWHLMSEEK